MKNLFLTTLIIIASFLTVSAQTIFDFEVKTIEGETFDWNSVKGKKILVVNTASKCGLTPQYEDLEALYQKYKEHDFVILGFPANNFLSQEPGSNDEILEFCTKNYGVSFPMMSKISVKGDDIDPMYEWLTKTADTTVKWNFQKFMISQEGKLVDFVSPKVKPFDSKIINWIEE